MKVVADMTGERVVLYCRDGLRPHDPFTPRIPGIAPLLKAQNYIEAVLPWDGQVVDYDCCHFRRAGHPFGVTLCQLQADWLHLTPDFENPWLTVRGAPKEYQGYAKEKIVIARSPRYQNWHFPWGRLVEKFRKHLLFIGNQQEHIDFCDNFGHVQYLPTPDLLVLAQVISDCKLFIGNQSSPFAICEGLKHNCIQETSLESPDCIYRRPNAQHIYDGGLYFELFGHRFASQPFKVVARAHLGETPPGGWRVKIDGHTVQSYALESVLQQIQLKLLADGKPVPKDLYELIITQSSVDMPPPPPMAPIKQIQELLERI